jgi:hypothetical protein
MNLPSIIDITAISAIGVLVLAIMQYIKEPVPVKLVPACSILVGIGVAFLYFYKPGVSLDFVAIIANGVLGAVFADTGYNFLSASQSPPLSLSSKKEVTVTPKEVKTP